jgi:hypothetical protein
MCFLRERGMAERRMTAARKRVARSAAPLA